MPERIQRKRTKGWKMPKNTVCVTRPGKWGNPFNVAYYRDVMGMTQHQSQLKAVEFFKRCIMGNDEPFDDAEAERMDWMRDHIRDLRGKNLACWCAPGTPCHADVLLDMANT